MTITYTVKHVVMREDDETNELFILPGGDSGVTFETVEDAYSAGNAAAFNEREALGYPPGDERIQFPDRYRSPE